MTSSFPRQGEVYLIKALKTLGDTKKRPAVIISMNVRNEFNDRMANSRPRMTDQLRLGIRKKELEELILKRQPKK